MPNGKRPPNRPPHRRTPPPAQTGAELGFFTETKEARTPVALHLDDGSTVHGVIEYFDRDMVKLTRAEGPHLFLRKDDIRYVEENVEPPAPKPKPRARKKKTTTTKKA